ncbi:MAG: hypothetical protein A3E36_04195 [Candidatus Andersenbacteria bacterium RIFCSPHIGHO2_12_FULL_45_11b]|uniref:Transposase IS200-like domain-containing protein n=1 Tax=Candidatus Andersenbacteria bacterium RIFCSPHIGHO2_12_FULL_45_11b TaxID=1797282 RepID=A0A1G1XAG8_9BACT|nr:MAG: hypothetical protein A3E36_04195 [Candidatus Andersenbacteria bacterium RIFCSPHIGHO2_12_FULL_45_11b]
MSMGSRNESFEVGSIYHIFSRGVEKRAIFLDDDDRYRMIMLFRHCLPRNLGLSFSNARKLHRISEWTTEGQGLVDVLCYCLMDNHIHLLLRENIEHGMTKYLQRVLNGYAKYFNLNYGRSGPLFGSRFHAVRIMNDEQLLHASRYIHINPAVAKMTTNILAYPWSSIRHYVKYEGAESYAHTSLITALLSEVEYEKFVLDQINYEQSLAAFPKLFIDEE